MDTSLFIVDESALLYWRKSLGRILNVSRPAHILDLSSSVHSYAEANELLADHAATQPDEITDLPRPLHIIVPNAGMRAHTKKLVTRAWAHVLPPRAFWRVGKGIYVASPPFLFLLMASRLGSVELAMPGNELCGLFSYNPDHDDGFDRRGALTSAAAIAGMLEGIDGVAGIKRARLAASWVLDKARSPMESELGLRFSLAPHWGGYGVSIELNPRIKLTARAARIAGQQYAEPDLYVPLGCASGRGIDLEYQGDKWHAMRVGKDARRRNALIDMGIDVVDVAKEQARSLAALDDIARLVRKKAGMRPLDSSAAALRRRKELHEELLRIRWQGEAGRTHSCDCAT